MTFPVLVGKANWVSAAIVLDSPEYRAPAVHKAVMPAGIQAGDLIVVFASKQDSGYGDGNDPKWTEFGNASNAQNINSRSLWAIANGSESGQTLTTFSLAGARTGVSHTYVYRGNGAAIAAPWVASASALNPNPPAVTGPLAENTYLVAACLGGTAANVSAPPANYGAMVNTYQAGCRLATAWRNALDDTDDPGPFTISVAAPWHTTTIVIPGTAPLPKGTTQAILIA